MHELAVAVGLAIPGDLAQQPRFFEPPWRLTCEAGGVFIHAEIHRRCAVRYLDASQIDEAPRDLLISR